ncbi:hypothetical protein PsorP6_003238 [Peronosclerospora sorghi]|uniref:Uncharacterized protein n=1 Tax=Peronosclerospora sorghi TaxID=230839 RepID=A0ACC0VKZ6_9STRA|nr:hypothetical protein PsorP6_003238 [Peronosclerospora sorghi]
MATLSASEMEFIAEQELITIMPHFHLRDNNGMLNFIGVREIREILFSAPFYVLFTFLQGDFGPFQPGITTHVPLWLAIMLKQLNKCRIVAPAWLSVDYLTSRLEREKASTVFEELPFHYMEIASLLLKKDTLDDLSCIFFGLHLVSLSSAPDDLDQSEHVRSLVEDLQNVRQDKIRNGLAKIADDVQSGETAFVIQMNNISALEITSVREFMLGVRFAPKDADVDERGTLIRCCILYLLFFWQSLNQFYRLSQVSSGAGAYNYPFFPDARSSSVSTNDHVYHCTLNICIGTEEFLSQSQSQSQDTSESLSGSYLSLVFHRTTLCYTHCIDSVIDRRSNSSPSTSTASRIVCPLQVLTKIECGCCELVTALCSVQCANHIYIHRLRQRITLQCLSFVLCVVRHCCWNMKMCQGVILFQGWCISAKCQK